MGSNVVVRPLHRWNDPYELYNFVHDEREGLNRELSSVAGLVERRGAGYDPDHGGRKVEFFRRFGFVDEGTMRRAARLRDGSFTDVALLARIRPPL